MPRQFKRLSHSVYECKYHIVFCSKYRYQILRDEVAQYTRQQIYRLCQRKDGVEVLELKVQPDHVHLVLSIPPKYAVSNFMGCLKGKLAIRLFAGMKDWRAATGASPMVERVLREHHWPRRRQDTQVCEVARAAREASGSHSGQVV